MRRRLAYIERFKPNVLPVHGRRTRRQFHQRRLYVDAGERRARVRRAEHRDHTRSAADIHHAIPAAEAQEVHQMHRILRKARQCVVLKEPKPPKLQIVHAFHGRSIPHSESIVI